MRERLGREQVEVLESVDTVANALIVYAPGMDAARVASLPGVKKIHPVREFRMMLDHALPVHQVPAAWAQVGGPSNAGTGIKIGVIDSGVDATHPGMQDDSLAIPDGFPKVNADSDLAYTSHKVIVARSYMNLLRQRDPDQSAQDHQGHGTAVAMAAAGVQNAGPRATITGVAPRAYVGSYKVFGSPAVNGTTSESAILKALDDAVADGMDVINLSFGSQVAERVEDDLEVAALARADALGVLVVVSAGNGGPDPNTMSSPATAPTAIAVGASANERTFAATVTTDATGALLAIPGEGSADLADVRAPLVDVSRLDGDGLACGTFPPGSLSGRVAFVLRGICTFETKLRNAQTAGAIGALVYSDAERPTPAAMGTAGVQLPAEMISYGDGTRLKRALGAQDGLVATLRFTLSAQPADAGRLAEFSAQGPNVDMAVKPDLVAVGSNFYTATQKLDQNGEMYSADRYTLTQGTSFSAPLVTGAAALLKAARPGLTPAMYRSLLINSAAPLAAADGTTSRVQQAGAGLLDAAAMLRITAAIAPTQLSFGLVGTPVTRSLIVTNVGTARERFQLSVTPRDGGTAPALSQDVVELEPGAAQNLTLSLDATSLPPGASEGFVRVQSTTAGTESRVPYWFAVASQTPRRITVLYTEDEPRAGATVDSAILFRVTDDSGLPLTDIQPTVTVVSGGGRVRSTVSADQYYPGVYAVSVRTGTQAGSNVFRVQVGDLVKDVTLVSK